MLKILFFPFVCLSVRYQIGIYKIYFLSLPIIVNINSGVCLFCSLMEMKKNSRKSYHPLMWMMMNFHYYNMTERTNKIILMSSSLICHPSEGVIIVFFSKFLNSNSNHQGVLNAIIYLNVFTTNHGNQLFFRMSFFILPNIFCH